ncbi:MAG: acylneuraminate cytidylyltransferase family protein [Chitinophagaceae bacterium]|nr:acylneuraminate cytidylyltransferase family protein [Chitinophagaceae bacterium]
MSPQILWLIAARSGSKSIPNKNIKLLNGVPLLTYRVKTALHFLHTNNIWCSTDSKEYAEIAIQSGALVPFLRPLELAGDNSSSIDVVLHAMDFAEQNNYTFDGIALLEPTSPFVYYEDIDNAIQLLFNDEQATSIVAVKENRPNTIFVQNSSAYLEVLAQKLEEIKCMGRQNFETQITPSGGFYISKWKDFRSYKTFYTPKTLPYLVPPECSLEIDEEIDWGWAEYLINNGIVNTMKIF